MSLKEWTVPIRLTQTPTTCRVRPIAGIKLGVGRGHHASSYTEERAESVEGVTSGVQRKRTTPEILTDLLRAEATHRHAASIRYRMSAAKLPVVKDIDAFVFGGTPINEGLVRSLHAGSFLPGQRNIVLVGGTDPTS